MTEAAVTAALIASSYLLVHYGSEARGYSGLILASLLFILVTERWLEAPKRWHGPALGAITLFGLLNHLTMLFTLAFIGAWVAWTFWRREQRIRPVVAGLSRWDRGPVAGALLFGLLVIPGVIAKGGIGVGALTSFSFLDFTMAYDTLFKTAVGLPAHKTAVGAGLAVAAAILALAIRREGSEGRAALGAIVLLGMPGLVIAAQLSNSEFPRYFLLAGLVLLLLVAREVAEALRARGWPRIAAMAAMTLILLGNMAQVQALHENGRDQHSAAMAYLAEVSTGTVRLGSVAPRARLIAEWQAGRQGIDLLYIPGPETWCGKAAPDWLVIDVPSQAGATPITLGRPDCPVTFAPDRAFPAEGLSSLGWWLYRRR